MFSANDFHATVTPCECLLLVQEGLRTLCVAYRPLSSEQYQEVCHLLNGAKLALQDRDKRLAEAYDLIEKDLILLGATAVEDRWTDALKCLIFKWPYSYKRYRNDAAAMRTAAPVLSQFE